MGSITAHLRGQQTEAQGAQQPSWLAVAVSLKAVHLGSSMVPSGASRRRAQGRSGDAVALEGPGESSLRASPCVALTTPQVPGGDPGLLAKQSFWIFPCEREASATRELDPGAGHGPSENLPAGYCFSPFPSSELSGLRRCTAQTAVAPPWRGVSGRRAGGG